MNICRKRLKLKSILGESYFMDSDLLNADKLLCYSLVRSTFCGLSVFFNCKNSRESPSFHASPFAVQFCVVWWGGGGWGEFGRWTEVPISHAILHQFPYPLLQRQALTIIIIILSAPFLPSGKGYTSSKSSSSTTLFKCQGD